MQFAPVGFFSSVKDVFDLMSLVDAIPAHSLPFKVALDTKTREFQYKILNRYLVTNTFLKKIGKTDSSACSFCDVMDESNIFSWLPILLQHCGKNF